MSVQGDKLKAIADAIRAKEGTSAPITANDFPARIMAIETGVDTSDATATASDIARGKTAYVDGEKVTGTVVEVLPSRPTTFFNGINTDVSGGNYSVESDGTVHISNIIFRNTVSEDKLVRVGGRVAISAPPDEFGTATATDVLGGKTFTSSAGLKVTGTMPTKAATTITPGTSAKTAISAGTYAKGTITVAGDSNLTPGSILYGTTIFGVSGIACKYYSGKISTAGTNIDKGLTSVKYRIMSSAPGLLNTPYTATIRTTLTNTTIVNVSAVVVTATCKANYPSISVTNATVVNVGYPTVAATTSATTQGTWIILPNDENFVINVAGTSASSKP